jgi:ADP-dependent NAD(P)H-hydrate dehydratase / NAD(P)H-hydrate epimerase
LLALFKGIHDVFGILIFHFSFPIMQISNSQQIRRADQIMIEENGFPGLLLMETAGRKCAEWILSHDFDVSFFVILAGPGNNGGDGLVIARHLHLSGKKVLILFAQDPNAYQGDALVNWKALQGAGISSAVWPEPLPEILVSHPGQCLLIDALLGTGTTNTLRGPVAEIISACANLTAPVIAIDLPSGLNADTGQCLSNPLKATTTLTFQLPKICHYLTPAASFCGQVVTLDIGIWPHIVQKLGIKRQLLDLETCRGLYRKRFGAGHKGTFGHALLVGGSKAYAGAIALSGMAALQAGAGLSTIFTTESARCAVYEARAELMVRTSDTTATPWLDKAALPALTATFQGKSAVAVGPGMGNEAESTDFLAGLLQAWPRPLVLDADALNLLASDPELWRWVPQGSILTPHPGEMARLMPMADPVNQRLETAETLAQQKQVIVVLKGKGTVIALPDGRSYINSSGNEGMATGGAGDVLTGMLAGLLAQGYSPTHAALLAVYLHGLAGDICAATLGATEAVTASGISNAIGKAFQQLQ